MKFKEYLQLTEARDPKLDYADKKVKGAIDRVTVALTGNQSGKFTKLSKEYAKLKKATETLAAKTSIINAKIKDEALALYDAQDEIYTRVVDTVSMTITISKKTEVISSKTDYDKIIAGLLELVPELTEQVNDLIKANTSVKVSERSPSLRVDVKEALDFSEVKAFAKKIYSGVKSWAKTFDKRFNKLQSLVDAL